MTDINKYALYSINQQNANALEDITGKIHNKLIELKEYDKIKNYINEHFGNFEKPGDKTGFKFPKMNKSILCTIDEASTILVFCKTNDAEQMDWVHLVLKDDNRNENSV